jgi:tetratricopeptide (TPR) repeat protein
MTNLRRTVLLLLGGVALHCGATASATGRTFATSKPPTAVEIEEVMAAGPEVAEEIRQAIWREWQPSRGGFQGTLFQPAPQQWLDLARWVDLLGRSEDEEWARFLGGYLQKGEEDASGRPGLVYRLPGQVFREERPGWEPAELREIATQVQQREFYGKMLLPAGFSWKGGSLSQRISPELALALAKNPARLREFFTVLSTDDFTPGVLDNLDRLHRHNPTSFEKNFSLALALAVVFDQPPPPDWPHHQVNPSAIPADRSSLEERFDFWVTSLDGKKLMPGAAELGADQWKYIVDALVAPEELEWARKNVRTARGQFHRVFSSIKYDFPRLKSQAYSWPHPGAYSLANIQKLGGICVDQAYFAAVAGKAHGLPTLYFSGQGADGGHAWFGYLKATNRWDLDAGRYENQNYAVGHALDPQSWQPISDHELQFISSRVRSTPAFQAAEADLTLAAWHTERGQLDEALRAVDSALAAVPQHADAWEEKGRLLTATGADPAVQAAHWEAARKAFPNNPDLQTRFQTRMAGALREKGEDRSARELEQRMISQNQRQRADLSVEAAARKVLDLAEGKDWEGALAEFRLQSNRLGRTGGGNFFYEITRPLCLALLEAGRPRDAQRVLEQSRRALQPDRGSILDQELNRLSQEVESSGNSAGR